MSSTNTSRQIAILIPIVVVLFGIIIATVIIGMVSYKRSVLVDWEGKSGTLNIVEDGSRAYLQIPVLEDMEKTFQFEDTVYEVEYVRGDRIYLKRRDK